MNLNSLRRIFKIGVDTATPSVQADVEILEGETRRDLEVLEPYGLTSCPPDNVVEGIAGFVNGDSDHGIVLGWLDKANRPKNLNQGEVTYYSIHGQKIEFTDDGAVKITDGAGGVIFMDGAGGINITSQTLTHNGVNIGATHEHPQNIGNHFGGGVNTGAPQ